MDLLSRLPGLAGWVLAVALVSACSEQPARVGIVEEAETERVLIAQAEVGPGELPESAWIAVGDPALLENLVPGRRIAYRLRAGGGMPRLAEVSVLGWAGEDEGWIADPDGGRLRARPAPALELYDQDGRRASLADWRGDVVLVDFIYTRCPGPCPAQTHDLVSVQRGLSPAARERARFASVTLEPEYDKGPILRAYAEKHGVDFADWSFLTGEPEHVAALAREWGIGSSAEPSGEIAHTLHSFLVDDRGYVVARFSSRDRDPGAIRMQIERFARAAAGSHGAAAGANGSALQ